ncbi:GyrI-like domain-containing protein [Leucobacter salsicius]|uniref:GyrI-like domain-containing protein n=1 Tax=Leucobacter salsicius TaxID=664638 RepID=UPI00034D915A|nr:GyrI-like domain-containing protein [Leucobacter salsicius]
MVDKIDFKKTLDGYRAKQGEFRMLELPEMRYLMIDGAGDPNTSAEYAAALAALYPVAYALKFASKRELGRDYVVPPLEGLWWADDMDTFTVARDKTKWRWTMMLMVPDWIPEHMFEGALAAVRAKGAPDKLNDVRLTSLAEGRCVQTLHVGSFDDEGPVLERLHHEFVPANGLTPTGRHHEIYLSDPRRNAPEKLRTILRQPVAPATGRSGAA